MPTTVTFCTGHNQSLKPCENVCFCFYKQHHRKKHRKLSFTDVLKVTKVEVLSLICMYANKKALSACHDRSLVIFFRSLQSANRTSPNLRGWILINRHFQPRSEKGLQ